MTARRPKKMTASPSTGKDTVARCRLPAEEKLRWQARASKAGLTLSEWIRARCSK